MSPFVEGIEDALQWLGIVVPNGDPDKLKAAAEVWRALASDMSSAASTLGAAGTSLTSAEFPSSPDTIAVRASSVVFVTAISDGATEIADNLVLYADNINNTREELLWMVGEFAIEIAIDIGLTIALSFIPGGTILGSAKAAVTIAKWARKINELIDRLRGLQKLAMRAIRAAGHGMGEAVKEAVVTGFTTVVINTARANDPNYQQRNPFVAAAAAGISGGATSPIGNRYRPGGAGHSTWIKRAGAEGAEGAAGGVVEAAVTSAATGEAFNPLQAATLGALLAGPMNLATKAGTNVANKGMDQIAPHRGRPRDTASGADDGPQDGPAGGNESITTPEPIAVNAPDAPASSTPASTGGQGGAPATANASGSGQGDATPAGTAATPAAPSGSQVNTEHQGPDVDGSQSAGPAADASASAPTTESNEPEPGAADASASAPEATAVDVPTGDAPSADTLPDAGTPDSSVEPPVSDAAADDATPAESAPAPESAAPESPALEPSPEATDSETPSSEAPSSEVAGNGADASSPEPASVESGTADANAAQPEGTGSEATAPEASGPEASGPEATPEASSPEANDAAADPSAPPAEANAPASEPSQPGESNSSGSETSASAQDTPAVDLPDAQSIPDTTGTPAESASGTPAAPVNGPGDTPQINIPSGEIHVPTALADGAPAEATPDVQSGDAQGTHPDGRQPDADTDAETAVAASDDDPAIPVNDVDTAQQPAAADNHVTQPASDAPTAGPDAPGNDAPEQDVPGQDGQDPAPEVAQDPASSDADGVVPVDGPAVHPDTTPAVDVTADSDTEATPAPEGPAVAETGRGDGLPSDYGRRPDVLHSVTVAAGDPLAPKSDKPFGPSVTLAPNTEYHVEGREGTVFYTGPDGRIEWVTSKWSDSVANRNPDLNNPLPNVTYVIKPLGLENTATHNYAQVFQTDSKGQTVSTYTQDVGIADRDSTFRDRQLQSGVGVASTVEMNAPAGSYHGGHIYGTQNGGGTDALNMIGMRSDINSVPKGGHATGPHYGDTYYGMERDNTGLLTGGNYHVTDPETGVIGYLKGHQGPGASVGLEVHLTRHGDVGTPEFIHVFRDINRGEILDEFRFDNFLGTPKGQ